MHKLQILGDELDIDQRARCVFEIPGIGVTFFLGDRRAHLDHVGGNRARIALAPEHPVDRRLHSRGKGRWS